MNLTDLAQKLRRQAQRFRPIFLNDEILEEVGVNELIRSALGRSDGSRVLRASASHIPANPPPRSFSFPCSLPSLATDSFLTLLGNNCVVTFTQPDAQQPIHFFLEINLARRYGQPPVEWVFGDSFPTLSGLSYDSIGFTAPYFIF